MESLFRESSHVYSMLNIQFPCGTQCFNAIIENSVVLFIDRLDFISHYEV